MSILAAMSAGLTVEELAPAVCFYVDELGLFELGGERFYGPDAARLDRMLGAGEVHLRARHDSSFGLVLTLPSAATGRPTVSGMGTLGLEISNVFGEYQRLSSASLGSGARMFGDFLGTPVGDMFSMLDPSGNRVDFISSTPRT